MYTSMKTLLNKANDENYAVMAINAFNLESAAGIISAAEDLNSPIIIDLLQEHLLSYFDCDVLACSIIKMAEQSSVPVAINLDHGSNVDHLKKCVVNGFSGVMIDASQKPFEENVETTKAVIEFVKPFNVGVEAELGCMGLVGDAEGFTNSDMYTDPDQAIEFINQTNVDALAISYGSTHGSYPDGYVPTFRFDLVDKIKKATNIPLVLHGGSGAGAENIKKSVECGVNKINVGTHYMEAQRNFIAKELRDKPGSDYPELIHKSYMYGKEVVKYYINLSGSVNKA